MYVISSAPIRVSTTLGTPKISKIRLSKPCLKKLILPILPKMWRSATSTKAVLKSKKSNASGRKTVDEPNPAMVPTTSDK